MPNSTIAPAVRAAESGPKVVVTGLGCVTPYGIGVEPFWAGLVAGRSPIAPLEVFDARAYGTRIAGQIRQFEPREFMPQRDVSASARVTQLGVAAARMAADQARLPAAPEAMRRTGVFFGTSVGTFAYAAESHAAFLEKGIRRVHPLFPAQSYSGVVATQIAIGLEVRGPALCISTACASATDAIGMAWLHVRAGIVDRAIAGGAEAPLTPLIFASFDRLGVMSRRNEEPERSSRPFAAARDGFVMTEGAGAVVLESETSARLRGAPVLGEIAGYGASSDAFHAFSPLPSGEEGLRAIQIALEQAGTTNEAIDCVSAHAIGSRPNDPIELDILKQALGDRVAEVPVSAIKSMIGHSMGAAGVLATIAAIESLRTGMIPPTINLEAADCMNGLDLVPAQARNRSLKMVLVPTFGFGSRNSVLVVGRL
jgi:3-oxoacyl-[acyl-carrier-protein] synthase II